jgi:hypothetical protein
VCVAYQYTALSFIFCMFCACRLPNQLTVHIFPAHSGGRPAGIPAVAHQDLARPSHRMSDLP